MTEESGLLNETNQSLKKELQSQISELEEKLKEQKEKEDELRSKVENLLNEAAEKPVLQSRLKEIEEQLVKAESVLKEKVGLEFFCVNLIHFSGSKFCICCSNFLRV